jgi:hypothetical protein
MDSSVENHQSVINNDDVTVLFRYYLRSTILYLQIFKFVTNTSSTNQLLYCSPLPALILDCIDEISSAIITSPHTSDVD